MNPIPSDPRNRSIPTVRTATALLLGAGLLLSACGEGEPEPAAESAPSAQDTVQAAMASYDASAFDTIQWESQEAALQRGSLVFRVSCAKCHGDRGDGTGGFVTEGDTLEPPSFLTADWRFADDPEGLREQIYVGTARGMPHWGLEGLRYRDIDAVTIYVQEQLRSGL